MAHTHVSIGMSVWMDDLMTEMQQGGPQLRPGKQEEEEEGRGGPGIRAAR